MSKKEKNNDLIGFQDFLEYQDEKIAGHTSRRNRNTGFELYSFIERESERLTQFLTLFEEKAFMLKKYPQDTKIIIDTESKIIEERINLINKIKHTKSQVNVNINELLSTHFNKI